MESLNKDKSISVSTSDGPGPLLVEPADRVGTDRPGSLCRRLLSMSPNVSASRCRHTNRLGTPERPPPGREKEFWRRRQAAETVAGLPFRPLTETDGRAKRKR
jgi:hypothetical protein